MNLRYLHRVMFAAVFAALAAAGRGIQAQQQSTPAPAQQPPQKPAGNSNDFPEDTSNVPVIRSNGINPRSNASDSAPPGSAPGSTNSATVPSPALPPAMTGDDTDPVRSPDDPVVSSSASESSSSSSSFAGLDRAMNPPDEDTDTPDVDQGRRHRGRNGAPKQPEHQETAKEDVDVGSYYLSTKNWHAALSRYQSALVLDPENPDVYWGLAEAQRNLKDFASARGNYQKLLDYDPDNKHAKEARKLLKDPDVANAAAQK